MKIRVGFVSNSSSQSFVMIGVDTKDISGSLKEKLAEKLGFKLPEWADSLDDVGIDDIMGRGKYRDADDGRYFGYEVAVTDDYTMESFSLSFKDIENHANELREFLAELGEDIEVRLIGGTEMC